MVVAWLATVKLEGVYPATVWQEAQSTGLPASVAVPLCASRWQLAHVAKAGFFSAGVEKSW